MAKKNVKFMLTAFRDGFQSVVGIGVLALCIAVLVAGSKLNRRGSKQGLN